MFSFSSTLRNRLKDACSKMMLEFGRFLAPFEAQARLRSCRCYMVLSNYFLPRDQPEVKGQYLHRVHLVASVSQ
jgi:hypothetical protein